jgi:hypothetical protein
MKIRTTLIAVALLGSAAGLTGIASATPTPPAAVPAPAPATTAPMAPKAPSSSDTTAPKTPSLKDCNKQAEARNLTGKDRATFVKSCQAGKTDPDD